MGQLPSMTENTSNYYSSSASAITLNSLYNSLNGAYNDELALLINGLNGMQLGDALNIGQSCQPTGTALQTTYALNHLSPVSPVTTNSDGCGQHHGKFVPKNYMCHLCFCKDHFIRDCPLVSFHIHTRCKQLS